MEQMNVTGSGSKPTGAKRLHESDNEMEERKTKMQKTGGWNGSQEAGLGGVNTAAQQLGFNQPTSGTGQTAFQGGSSTDNAHWMVDIEMTGTENNAHSAGHRAHERCQSAPP